MHRLYSCSIFSRSYRDQVRAWHINVIVQCACLIPEEGPQPQQQPHGPRPRLPRRRASSRRGKNTSMSVPFACTLGAIGAHTRRSWLACVDLLGRVVKCVLFAMGTELACVVLILWCEARICFVCHCSAPHSSRIHCLYCHINVVVCGACVIPDGRRSQQLKRSARRRAFTRKGTNLSMPAFDVRSQEKVQICQCLHSCLACVSQADATELAGVMLIL
jgi:hypothetical protein